MKRLIDKWAKFGYSVKHTVVNWIILTTWNLGNYECGSEVFILPQFVYCSSRFIVLQGLGFRTNFILV